MQLLNILIFSFRFSIRSFGSFDGTLTAQQFIVGGDSFSIRSFGSFDGTANFGFARRSPLAVSVSALSDHLMGPVAAPPSEPSGVGFSIRSFGSFDGTAFTLAIEAQGEPFQYPLFRII